VPKTLGQSLQEQLASVALVKSATRLSVFLGPTQIIFRFAQQVGMLPLTGTTSEQHMKEDPVAEQLTLSAEELRGIETDRHLRKKPLFVLGRSFHVLLVPGSSQNNGHAPLK